MTNTITINGRTFATDNNNEGLYKWTIRYNKPVWAQIYDSSEFSVKNIKYDHNKKAKVKKAVIDLEGKKVNFKKVYIPW